MASHPSSKNAQLAVAIVALIALAGGAFFFVSQRQGGTVTPLDGGISEPTASGPTSAFDSADRREATFVPLEPVEATEPLFWLDVLDPRATHAALKKNAWLDEALKSPVGQGFFSAWGGFFGTRGQDIGGSFQGPVADLLMGQVLDTPYRVTWFGGEGVKGAPALVVPAPSPTARAGFTTLVKVAGSGGFKIPGCASQPENTIHRVVLADKTLFVLELGDRLMLSTSPQALQVAQCEEATTLAPREGVAVSLGLSLKQGGRGAQSVGELVGLDQNLGFDFAVQGDGFAPRGLDARVTGARLATVEPSESLLKSIPESAGVVLFLAVKLPQELTGLSLRDTLAAEDESFKGTRKKWPAGPDRQIAVVWNPRATGDELAVIWDHKADKAALDNALVKGSGKLKTSTACPGLAFATESYLATLEATCKGTKPSMLQAAAPVLQGLKKSSSFSLTVNLGRVLSQLTLDGYLSEHPNEKSGPTEIEAARRLLETLPSIGFTGAAKSDGTLVSQGFRS